MSRPKSRIGTMGVEDKAQRMDMGRRASQQNHTLGARPQKVQDPLVEVACIVGPATKVAPLKSTKGNIDATECSHDRRGHQKGRGQ